MGAEIYSKTVEKQPKAKLKNKKGW